MNDLLFEEANMLLAYLRNEYKRIEDELSHMPSGRLTIARSRRWTKWYLRDGEKTNYLPKSESEFASIMARKRFLEAKLQDIKCEIRALTSYIQKHPTICTSCQMLEQGSLYASFLSRFSNYPTEVQQWATADYPQNDFHSESKKFKSISGNLVRSKSELMIDEALYRNGIPFHYDDFSFSRHIPPRVPPLPHMKTPVAGCALRFRPKGREQ